jgi:hypothetical protein
MTLWKLDFPANALEILKLIKMIALMEFLTINWFTNALSKWFGIEINSKDNLIENMGMMLLIGCSVLVVILILVIASVLACCSYKIYKVI